jgi:inorganic pyrophosphatase
MTGETDLATLLSKMQPVLHEQSYVFCSVSQHTMDQLPFIPLGVFREQEGISIIVTLQQATDLRLPIDATWACITLTVHSSLSAVGFLALITARLARSDISVNPVSAYYHDHLFVPWESRLQAMEILHELSQVAGIQDLRSTEYIGKVVTIEIDRPMGSLHPEHGFIYPVNYGYVPGTISPDGQALDAYVLGVFEPLDEFNGMCIAVLHRLDDDDDKLVLTPEGKNYSDEQIRALTEFQERFFQSVIVRQRKS